MAEKLNLSDFAIELASWIARGSPLPAHYLLKPIVVASYMKASGFGYFVETGTYFGRTTEFISRLGVEIDTFELSDDLWARAEHLFAGNPRIRCHHGDSGELLKAVLPRISGPALYWLDGHYSGEGTALGKSYTPLMAELAAIAVRANPDDVILIDDVRCCGTNGYPKEEFLIEYGRQYFSDRPATIRNDTMIFAKADLHEKAVAEIPSLIALYAS